MILNACERMIMDKTVACYLARLTRGATELKCSEFGEAFVDNMEG